ncbi:MAG: DEAD/DEAH box helicase [archaeon]|nr:DEAD/DEAH box helicase [archaeon]
MKKKFSKNSQENDFFFNKRVDHQSQNALQDISNSYGQSETNQGQFGQGMKSNTDNSSNFMSFKKNFNQSFNQSFNQDEQYQNFQRNLSNAPQMGRNQNYNPPNHSMDHYNHYQGYNHQRLSSEDQAVNKLISDLTPIPNKQMNQNNFYNQNKFQFGSPEPFESLQRKQNMNPNLNQNFKMPQNNSGRRMPSMFQMQNQLQNQKRYKVQPDRQRQPQNQTGLQQAPYQNYQSMQQMNQNFNGPNQNFNQMPQNQQNKIQIKSLNPQIENKNINLNNQIERNQRQSNQTNPQKLRTMGNYMPQFNQQGPSKLSSQSPIFSGESRMSGSSPYSPYSNSISPKRNSHSPYDSQRQNYIQTNQNQNYQNYQGQRQNMNMNMTYQNYQGQGQIQGQGQNMSYQNYQGQGQNMNYSNQNQNQTYSNQNQNQTYSNPNQNQNYSNQNQTYSNSNKAFQNQAYQNQFYSNRNSYDNYLNQSMDFQNPSMNFQNQSMSFQNQNMSYENEGSNPTFQSPKDSHHTHSIQNSGYPIRNQNQTMNYQNQSMSNQNSNQQQNYQNSSMPTMSNQSLNQQSNQGLNNSNHQSRNQMNQSNLNLNQGLNQNPINKQNIQPNIQPKINPQRPPQNFSSRQQIKKSPKESPKEDNIPSKISIDFKPSNLVTKSQIEGPKQKKRNPQNKSEDEDLDEILASIDVDQLINTPLKQGNKKQSNLNSNPSLNDFPLRIVTKDLNLNEVQNGCFDLIYNSNRNALITAPTGSGKTMLFEFGICRVIKENYNYNRSIFKNKAFKIIYLAPIKSLCQEKIVDWRNKFSQSEIGLNVLEVTGDSEYVNFNQVNTANLILTTPEKFDILTRKWKETQAFIGNISLLLIDEVHILNEEYRGGIIEAIISRMKLLGTLPEFQGKNICELRTIALSATIPNIPEVAEFLQVEPLGIKIFGEESRPIQVQRYVFGYPLKTNQKKQNEFQFDRSLDFKVADIIDKYSEGKPVLIFCPTQKSTVNLAKQLVNDIQNGKLNAFVRQLSPIQEKAKLELLSKRVSNKDLSGFVRFGIGFHHGGLSQSDRSLLEENMRKGIIKVICTTSTLAQGVNLPARLVIIKNTTCYRGTKVGYTDYNKIEIDQMVGRAGRINYDTKGLAIIMTEESKVSKFEDLNTIMIESHLNDNLTEHINAEISSGIVYNINTAINWISHTFMYVRMKNNPHKYNIGNFVNCKKMVKGDSKPKSKAKGIVDKYLKTLCKNTFKELSMFDLIEYKEDIPKKAEDDLDILEGETEDNFKAFPKRLCKKMSKNYVMFDTIKSITKALRNNTYKSINTDENILNLLSISAECMKYHSKNEERKTLNEINKKTNVIKYSISGPIDTPWKKCFILMQAFIGGYTNLEQWELRRQQSEIIQVSIRILNCLREILKIRDDAKGYLGALFLRKCLLQGIWYESDLIMKQFPKIGDKLARNFLKEGIKSFDQIRNSNNPRQFETICNKSPPFGNVLIEQCNSIPALDIKFESSPYQNNSDTFRISLEIEYKWKKLTQNDFDSYSTYRVVFVENGKIYFKQKIRPNSFGKKLNLFIPGLKKENFPLFMFFICDKFIGLDTLIILESENDKVGTTYRNQREILRIVNLKLNCKSAGLLSEPTDEEIAEALNGFDVDSENVDVTPKKSKKKKKGKKSKKKKKENNAAPKTLNEMGKEYGKHEDVGEMINRMLGKDNKNKENQSNKKKKDKNPFINSSQEESLFNLSPLDGSNLKPKFNLNLNEQETAFKTAAKNKKNSPSEDESFTFGKENKKNNQNESQNIWSNKGTQGMDSMVGFVQPNIPYKGGYIHNLSQLNFNNLEIPDGVEGKIKPPEEKKDSTQDLMNKLQENKNKDFNFDFLNTYFDGDKVFPLENQNGENEKKSKFNLDDLI